MLEDDWTGGVEIRNLILPDVEEKGENYEKLVYLAKKRGVRVMKIHEGESFFLGKTGFYCLNPVKGRSYSDVNAASVCLLVRMEDCGFSALYTGDVQKEGEEELIKGIRHMRDEGSFSGELSLLKCAHHGSRNSTPEELLSLLSPKLCFISAGAHNRYGHPHKELLERVEDEGCRIYVTAERGALMMEVGYGKAKVRCYFSDARRDENDKVQIKDNGDSCSSGARMGKYPLYGRGGHGRACVG